MPSRDQSPVGDTGQNESFESNFKSSDSAQNYRYQTSSTNQADTFSNANNLSFERFESNDEQGLNGDTSLGKTIWSMNDGGQFNQSSSSQNFQSSFRSNNPVSQDGNLSIGSKREDNSSRQQNAQSDSNDPEPSRSLLEQMEAEVHDSDMIGQSVVEQMSNGPSKKKMHTEQNTNSASEDRGTETGSATALESNTGAEENAQGAAAHEETGATARSGGSATFTDRNIEGGESPKDDQQAQARIFAEQSPYRDSFEEPSERTPLLPQDRESNEDLGDDASTKKKKTRWPSYVALGTLCVAVILAIVFGFAAPAAVEEYAKEAITFEPGDLAVESFTNMGLEARARGVFYLDGSKVQKKTVRDLGRFATWIAKEVEINDAVASVYLAEYNNSLLGTARVPPIKVNIQNGHHNYLDIVSNVEPGDLTQIRTLALDVMDGKQTLEVNAILSANVKSGILTLGRKTITSSMTLHRSGNTTLPSIHISNLVVGEYGIPGYPEGIIAQANVSTFNKYPVHFNVPPLAFNIMLKDCSSKPLSLGTMNTEVIRVVPKNVVNTTVTGFMHELPTNLTQTCQNSDKSPLDKFIGSYLAGEETQIYVSGGKQDPERTPGWIGNILSDVVVPVPVPPHTGFNHMIKNFSLSNVHFNLPQLGVDPYPRLSAVVNVVVGLPKHINVNVSVDRVRADADMYFKGKQLGVLDLREWQSSNSSKIDDELHVQSIVKEAPLKITDQNVFAEVLSAMIFGSGGLTLEVRARVDVRTTTVLGQFVVRQLPASGSITIKPMTGAIQQKVKDISVVGSSAEELIIRAKVEVVNPTDYAARVPYVNVSVWCNETRLGYAWGSFDVRPGLNELVVEASYTAGPVGAELLSQYISGWNTSLTIRTHNGSIPGLPDPRLSINVPMPHTFGKFMKEATMHIFSSSVTFVLFSPLQMLITSINAHAYYNGTDIGSIKYTEPIAIQAGENETPNLPVAWNLNGGLKLIRDALGGTLKVDARADVGIKMGQWEERVWYEGKGLGAKVKLFSEPTDL